MALYSFCNLIVESDTPLPEIPTAHSKEPACTFHPLDQRPSASDSFQTIHHWRSPDGNITLSLARNGADYLLRFPDLADFSVSADMKDITCHPVPNTSLETLRDLLLDQVLPRVLSQRGNVVLHASAVLSPEGGIVFLGESGSGKSTLAMSFHRNGLPFLTDDCLLLQERAGQWYGIPAHSGIRLRPDALSALVDQESILRDLPHHTQKEWMALHDPAHSCCLDPVPLKSLYVLAPCDEYSNTKDISLVPLSRRDGFVALLRNAYRLDVTDQKRLGEEFEYLAQASASLTLYRLEYPRRFSYLPSLQEAIVGRRKHRN